MKVAKGAINIILESTISAHGDPLEATASLGLPPLWGVTCITRDSCDGSCSTDFVINDPGKHTTYRSIAKLVEALGEVPEGLRAPDQQPDTATRACVAAAMLPKVTEEQLEACPRIKGDDDEKNGKTHLNKEEDRKEEEIDEGVVKGDGEEEHAGDQDDAVRVKREQSDGEHAGNIAALYECDQQAHTRSIGIMRGASSLILEVCETPSNGFNATEFLGLPVGWRVKAGSRAWSATHSVDFVFTSPTGERIRSVSLLTRALGDIPKGWRKPAS